MEAQSTTILDILTRYEPQSFHHEVPVIWDRASGYYVWDNNGKQYLDFTSGIFVANIGHNHPRVVQAIKEQADKMLHNYAFPSEVRARLVKKLCDMTGFEKCFLCSTGAEAIEVVIRCMGDKPEQIYALPRANHGRTWGARRITTHHRGATKGIIIETYYGYNAEFHTRLWVEEWMKWSHQYKVPICFDEIQAGFGRTGKLFGYQWYGVKPDMIVLGKALGGGLPISAVLGSAEIMDKPQDLSSTHSGNPVCCAAALATLEVLEEEKLVEKSRNREWIGGLLEETYPELLIRGHGMIWGIDLKDIELANRIVYKCAERGLLLVKTNRGTIKIGPPLIISDDSLKEGLGILKGVIYEIAPYSHSS